MLKSLAVMITERLSGDAVLQSLNATVYHGRAPVKAAKPYVIFVSPDTTRDETSKDAIEMRDLEVTIVGDQLAEQVQPASEQIIELLKDYAPPLAGDRIMWAQLVMDPVYGVDDDGSGDVWVGRIGFRYTLQRGRKIHE